MQDKPITSRKLLIWDPALTLHFEREPVGRGAAPEYLNSVTPGVMIGVVHFLSAILVFPVKSRLPHFLDGILIRLRFT
ncbi:Uncharacterized protein HZ326_25546 [Fusarium oxysporum f. sp. albedinis]|nr:Uncharacterized protein HZ326_25546 [Fusarium oxysporum f. sp. albedinis]